MTLTKPPFFIIGNPRSGTTLLRVMLTCHPQIVIPPECGFAVWLHRSYKDWGKDGACAPLETLADEILQCRKMETWGLSRAQLLEYFKAHEPRSWPEVCALVYWCYATSLGRRCTLWGDKNNYYLDFIPTIHAMFPDAKFIHIVRDGRDIACSYRSVMALEKSSKYAPLLPTDIREIALSWKKNLETIATSFDTVGRDLVTEVRLEDLTRCSSIELSRICDFLGVEYDPVMLDYPRLNQKQSLVPQEFLDWQGKTHKSPDPNLCARYANELLPEDLCRFEDIAGDLLRKYRYLA